MIDMIPKEMCVGCKACGDICPEGAIHYLTDNEGFWYPHIEYGKCRRCNLCDRTCPVSETSRQKLKTSSIAPKVYAAYHNNKKVRYNSTSGGVYYALADAILKEGGYLVGCAYTEDYRGAVHIVAEDRNGLKKLMRSKYFQSDTQRIYSATKTMLDDGKMVLFSGAPCHIAALIAFLGKEYRRLYTCDFICRGINSPMAYRKYMEELEKRYHSKIIEVHFKNKSQGWSNLGTLVKFENNRKYYRNRNTDPWVNAFIVGNLHMRPACTNCQFKKLPRVSDITYGDFWGLKVSPQDDYYGVSVIMENSVKGAELLNIAEKALFLEEHSLEEALHGNPALLNAVPLGEKREEFFRRIETEPYSKLVWKLIGLSWPKWQLRNYKLLMQKQLQKLKERLIH